ncbi:MAG: LCP family protein [Firmicutes bacterium]|nr:LCP family protein [Bacillota bacterium]
MDISIKQLMPVSIRYAIAIIVTFLSEAVFIFMMMVLDVIPAKYVILILLGMAVVDFILLYLMGRNGNRTSRLVAIVLSALMLIVMCVGSWYMFSTYKTLEKIAEYNSHFENYDVLALKDGSYQDEASIQGQKVYAFENDSKMYKEAKEKLITKAKVEYEMVGDSNEAISKLVDGNGLTSDNLVYISDTSYTMFCEENEEYSDKIQVLAQIKVFKRDKDNAARVDVTQDPYNICITGIDMWGEIDQVSRSDVNMIVTVNPQNRTILLTSMPRDSYVVLHSFGEYDKLTHTGVWGVDETMTTIEDWLETDLNYYVRVDFSMLRDIVNAIGGIDVYSDYAFKSAISDYKYKKGWNHLDGKAALYFARERKAFENEDQQRIINQQKVMKACIKKVTSSKELLTHYTKLLKAVDDEMETNLSEKEMAAIVKMQLNDMKKKWKITTQSVQGDLTMKGTYTMGMGRDLLVSIPREKSVEKVKENIHRALYPEDID